MEKIEIPGLGVSQPPFSGDFDAVEKIVIGKYKDNDARSPEYDDNHPICPVCDNYLGLWAEVEKKDEIH